MNGQTPTMEARPLTEAVDETAVEKYLRDYVKPLFLKLNDSQRAKALEVINKMVEGAA